MNLEHIINYLMQNPDNVRIEYSCVNGQESLKINGKDIESLEEEDVFTKKVNHYIDIVDRLDDCSFMDVLDSIKEEIPLKEFSDSLSNKNLSLEEKALCMARIDFVTGHIREQLTKKIEDLQSIIASL